MAAPIYSPGPLPSPVDYKIPGTAEIIPLSCFAVFDGSGAGGDFVPSLRFIDQDGNVISEVPTDSTVAAGDSAEVTFAPFLRGAASAAPVASALAYAHGSNSTVAGDPAIAINAHANKNAPFAHVSSSNAAVMAWSTFITGNDQLDLFTDGLYLCFGSAQFNIGAANMAAFPFSSTASEVPEDSWGTLDPVNFADPVGLPTNQGYTLYHRVGGAPAHIRFFMQNTGGVNANAVLAYMSVIYLGAV